MVLSSVYNVNHMCSDGVGLTGTFICLHSQMERLKTEGVVDFFQAVKFSRIQRAGLVPDAVCYVIYACPVLKLTCVSPRSTTPFVMMW